MLLLCLIALFLYLLDLDKEEFNIITPIDTSYNYKDINTGTAMPTVVMDYVNALLSVSDQAICHKMEDVQGAKK